MSFLTIRNKVLTFKKLLSYPKRDIVRLMKRIISQYLRRIGIGAYYCKALSGESKYNICVNSDLSVSCNCEDTDGSGQLGNLNHNSFQEIFDGEIAKNFRYRLAKGTQPIKKCHGCSELTIASKKLAREKAKTYSTPTLGIMVENTVLCCLKCLACDRNIVNIRRSADGKPGGTTMSLAGMKIVAKTIREHEVKHVCFLNQGEPFLAKTILEQMKIMRNFNPNIKIVASTNGIPIDSEEKMEAALLFDHISFSIDGSTQESYGKYQIGGSFQKALDNMKGLVEYRDSRSSITPVIEWKYVVFSWNDSNEEIERAILLAKNSKVDRITFCKGYLPFGEGISTRFNEDPFFTNLGNPSWKGREIDLRNQ